MRLFTFSVKLVGSAPGEPQKLQEKGPHKVGFNSVPEATETGFSIQQPTVEDRDLQGSREVNRGQAGPQVRSWCCLAAVGQLGGMLPAALQG